jgi:hypothetical protein
MTIHSSNPTRLPTALEKDAVFHSNAEDLLRVSEFLTLRSDPESTPLGVGGWRTRTSSPPSTVAESQRQHFPAAAYWERNSGDAIGSGHGCPG